MEQNIDAKVAREEKLVVEVPDASHQILLVEFVRPRGPRAFVPSRSRRRVAIASPAEEAKEAVIAARPLGYAFEARRFRALRDVLAGNDLNAPPGLTKAISRFDAMAAGVAVRK